MCVFFFTHMPFILNHMPVKVADPYHPSARVTYGLRGSLELVGASSCAAHPSS